MNTESLLTEENAMSLVENLDLVQSESMHLHRSTGALRSVEELWYLYIFMAAIGTQHCEELDRESRDLFEASIAAGGWFRYIARLRCEVLRYGIPVPEAILTDSIPAMVRTGWQPTPEVRRRLVEIASELTPLVTRLRVSYSIAHPGESVRLWGRDLDLVDIAEEVLAHLINADCFIPENCRVPETVITHSLLPLYAKAITDQSIVHPPFKADSRISTTSCPVRVEQETDPGCYCLFVDGENPQGVPITHAMFKVLSALVNAFPTGLTNLELLHETRVGDPANAIRNAIRRERALGQVLLTPGQAIRGVQGQYRIQAIRPKSH
jgi:hypothetical protein